MGYDPTDDPDRNMREARAMYHIPSYSPPPNFVRRERVFCAWVLSLAAAIIVVWIVVTISFPVFRGTQVAAHGAPGEIYRFGWGWHPTWRTHVAIAGETFEAGGGMVVSAIFLAVIPLTFVFGAARCLYEPIPWRLRLWVAASFVIPAGSALLAALLPGQPQ
jgi:hypothetical protein